LQIEPEEKEALKEEIDETFFIDKVFSSPIWSVGYMSVYILPYDAKNYKPKFPPKAM